MKSKIPYPSKGLQYWVDNKFMKWGGDNTIADKDDEQVMFESIEKELSDNSNQVVQTTFPHDSEISIENPTELQILYTQAVKDIVCREIIEALEKDALIEGSNQWAIGVIRQYAKN